MEGRPRYQLLFFSCQHIVRDGRRLEHRLVRKMGVALGHHRIGMCQQLLKNCRGELSCLSAIIESQYIIIYHSTVVQI